MKKLLLAGMVAGTALCPITGMAQHAHHHGAAIHGNHHDHSTHIQEPSGVMGAHMHDKGEWMLSYRYMYMDMEGQRDGTDTLSPEEIVSNFANPNAPPPNFRVVPTEMSMQMHMIGAMYAPTDWLTLMAMGSYIDKEMDHITFAGMAGTTRLGEFATESTGFGDTRVAGLIKLYQDNTHHLHLNAGLSLPTGSIDEEDDVLSPTGATPRLRLPYSMQLGTGTYDALPGLTYTGQHDQFGWGAQYSGEIRLEDENDEGYSWGDRHQLTAWGSYQWTPWFNASARIAAFTQDDIDGSDPFITAPVTTADPDNYGGETLSLHAGFTITPKEGFLDGHIFAGEIGTPVYQDLNGPQLETDLTVNLSWRKSF